MGRSWVLHGWDGPRPWARFVPVEVHQARAGAASLLQDAQSRADQLLADAERGAEEVRRQATEEGRAEGRRSVEVELLRLHRLRGELLGSMGVRRAAAELAAAMALRILGEAMATEPALWVRLCARAVASLRHSRAAVLRVHPSRARWLRSRLGELGGGRPPRDLTVREDEGVTPDGCLVESDLGTVDARLETQVAVLRDALLAGEER
ncbi:MAG TPA: FliH/SctL family protein [Myxococcaceae bacterium]|nr:FliH/SctL family protein [Myxococcaceae bacterium]